MRRLSPKQLIAQGWAVPVYKVCEHCGGGGRIQLMDGRSEAVVKCPDCRGRGHLGKRFVRLRDLLTQPAPPTQSGEGT